MKIDELNSKKQPIKRVNEIANKYSVPDKAAHGPGAGGFWLNQNIVNPIANGHDFVGLDGQLYYPHSYLGNVFFSPKPDIMQPYPVVANPV